MKKEIKKILCIPSLAIVMFTQIYSQTNTLTGTDAGSSIITGNDNTFNGYKAGNKNTYGSNNSFMDRKPVIQIHGVFTIR